MKLSSESWLVVGALLLAALLAAQEVRNEWKVTRSDSPDMVHFSISHSSRGNRWTQSNDVPRASFHGLNPGQSGVAKFEYIQDAGSLYCEGRFSFGAGSGSYLFKPNPAFTTSLIDLGYDAPTEAQAFSMMMSRVTLDFARGVRDAGVRATTGQLIELRNHGVTLAYVRETQNAGYTNFEARDLIELKNHGVSTEFLRAVKHAGYDLTSGRITELANHGVNSQFMRDLNMYGLKPKAGDLATMRDHGINPEYLKGLKDAGYGDLSLDQITELKNHGLDAKFMQESKDAGYSFTPRELIELRTHGVNAQYLRHLQESGMRNLTAAQITKLKTHGVE